MSSTKGPGAPQAHDGSSLRVAIVHARWNTTIIDALVSGAKKALKEAGVKDENVVVESAPGSYELPFAVQRSLPPPFTQSDWFCRARGLIEAHNAPQCRVYAASQIQSTSHSSSIIGGGGGIISSATTDLLGSTSSTSLTDLTKPAPSSSHASTASTAPFDALIAIGVLIKGETMHFEYIADAVTHGLMRVQLDTGVPVVFGLLTVLDEAQGMVRAGLGKGKEGHGHGASGHNHGEDWGAAAVELGVKRMGWGVGKMG